MKVSIYSLYWWLLGLVFVACYYSTFIWLNHKFSSPESYYSHGYLIPLVVLYILYDRRSVFKKVELSSNLYGLFLISFALSIHILGSLADISFISGYSIILFFIGCSLFLAGNEFTKHAIFPILYLVFMMPIPDEYLNTIALPLKSSATWFALKFMDLMNVPYIREGFTISLAKATYIVGTPCNGLRSLISFSAIGFLLFFFLDLSLWKKVSIIAIIPLIAIILNGVRIAILLITSLYLGQEAVSPENFLHDASGLFVFIIGIILMIAAVRYMHEKKSA